MEEQGINNQVTKKTLNTAIFKHKKNYETHSIIAMFIVNIKIDVNKKARRSS